MTGSTIVNNGINIDIDRLITVSPTKSRISQFSVGIGTTNPSVADTSLEIPIPISNGSVRDNGDNQFTGSNGGDNSTDNTITFKPGAGVSDDTAQDLIANNGNATKTWTSPDLAVSGSDMVLGQPFAIWLFIKDATALAKFKTSGTALELRIRTNGDGGTLFFQVTRTAAQLATGWNWITTGSTNVEDLTQGGGGAPSGDLDEFVIEITTNNATDTFTTGDVIYDLLRQWAASDLVKNMEPLFPSADESVREVTSRMVLLSTEANGFSITELGILNTDSTNILWSHDVFTSRSKTNTEEFRFIQRDRFIIV